MGYVDLRVFGPAGAHQEQLLLVAGQCTVIYIYASYAIISSIDEVVLQHILMESLPGFPQSFSLFAITAWVLIASWSPSTTYRAPP